MAANNSVDNLIFGRTDGTSPPAGYVGELIAPAGGITYSVPLTSGTPVNVATFTNVSAGDFEQIANGFFQLSAAATSMNLGWSTVSATLPAANSFAALNASTAIYTSSGFCAPIVFIKPTGVATYYLVAQASFTGTCNIVGQAYMRRWA